MYIDCLAHLHDPRIANPKQLLHRAANAGVRHVIDAGVDPRHDTRRLHGRVHGVGVWNAFGVHPQAVGRPTLDHQLQILNDVLSQGIAVAIGEAGLDKRRGMPSMELQQAAFVAQIDLAQRHHLPMLLHCVQASGRLVELLEEHGPLPQGGLLHGFSGPQELVPRMAAVGLYFSFGGLVTQPKAKRCRAAASVVPEDWLLVESDSPDHPPHGSGASLSEPAHVVRIVQELATLRDVSPVELQSQLARNAQKLFALPAYEDG